jgi:hypothetical protein
VSSRLDRAKIGSWVAAALVAAGGVTSLVALTVEGDGLPRASGGAWARATFSPVAADAGAPAGHESTVVVAMTVRGVVAPVDASDADLARLDGLAELPSDSGDSGDSGGAAAPVERAVPQSLTILAIWLSAGLLAVAGVMAVGWRRLRPLWPLVGAGALALLVSAVVLRQLTVGELGSWLADLDAARFTVRATPLSGLPVVGAVLALLGAIVGTVLGAPVSLD